MDHEPETRQKMKTLSIYNKLIIYFLAISLLPFIGFGFLAYHQINQVNSVHSLRTLNLIAVESAFKVQKDLDARETELRSWSGFWSIRQALLGGPADVARAVGEIDRLIAGYPMYDLLLLIDNDHRVAAANTRDRDGQELATADLVGSYLSGGPWFEEAGKHGLYMSGFRRSNVVADVYRSRGEGLVLSVPVRGESGDIVGFLVGYIAWSDVQGTLDVEQSAYAGETGGVLFMLNVETGRFVAHPNPRLYGESYPTKEDFAAVVRARPAGILHVDWPEEKTIGYAKVGSDGVGARPPWVVCLEVADEVIYRQTRLLRSLFVWLTLCAALMIIVAVYFISRRFSEPLLQLVQGAQAIAAGNMDVEMPVKSVDELGILANTFNQMSDSLRQRDEQLRLTNAQLEEANRLKSEFLANVSHELRTPMNSIIGFTTLVLQRAGDQLPELQRQNLGKVRRNALHLLKLLNSILDLAKIESGGMDVIVEEFPLRGLVDYCLQTIAPLIEARPLTLSHDVDMPDVAMFTDRLKLQQILINLLGNAAKFTEDGYIRVGVETVSDPGLPDSDDLDVGPWMRLWVEDSGIGIHERDAAAIFSEFRQVDGSPSRRYGGTGLGLSISKKLAKLLGGDILVQSEPGFGSTFTVVIPVRHKMAQPLVRDEYTHEMPGETPNGAPPVQPDEEERGDDS